MLGRSTRAYAEIENCTEQLLQGRVVAIDPSIGSVSSQPGWAVYDRGVLRYSGEFSIDPTGTVPERLTALATQLYNLYSLYCMTESGDEMQEFVLVYEDIPAQRRGGRGNAAGHASLLKSVGAILSVWGPTYRVGLSPVSWKAMVRDEYQKGDEADAIEIGWVAIECARAIENSGKTTSYKKREYRVLSKEERDAKQGRKRTSKQKREAAAGGSKRIPSTSSAKKQAVARRRKKRRRISV